MSTTAPEPTTQTSALPKPFFKKDYVAGFFFNLASNRVVLVQKQKPTWQVGKFNGVGGKVEPGESPDAAMRREFREEAGVDVEDWKFFCLIEGTEWRVFYFKAFGDTDRCKTMEAEEIIKTPMQLLDDLPLLADCRWLIPLALNHPNGSTVVVAPQA